MKKQVFKFSLLLTAIFIGIAQLGGYSINTIIEVNAQTSGGQCVSQIDYIILIDTTLGPSERSEILNELRTFIDSFDFTNNRLLLLNKGNWKIADENPSPTFTGGITDGAAIATARTNLKTRAQNIISRNAPFNVTETTAETNPVDADLDVKLNNFITLSKSQRPSAATVVVTITDWDRLAFPIISDNSRQICNLRQPNIDQYKQAFSTQSNVHSYSLRLSTNSFDLVCWRAAIGDLTYGLGKITPTGRRTDEDRDTLDNRVEISDFLNNIRLDLCPPVKWIYSTGNISANTGLEKIDLNNPTTSISFLSQNTLISGSNNLTSSKLSQKRSYALGYTNLGTTPSAGFSDWYDYLKNNFENNSILRLRNIRNTSQSSDEDLRNQTPPQTTPPTLSTGKLSSQLELFSDAFYAFQSTTLTIQNGANCDIQGVFFVENDITISGNLTNNFNNNGCVFIAKNNINISGNVSELNGFFIAGNQINIQNRSNASTLILNGGITASKVNIERTLGTDNTTSPSVNFNYDARYKSLFKSLFAQRGYSLREDIN